MNTKQKLTLGIAAIFMVTLTIVGVTYAYFVTQVQTGTPAAADVTTATFGEITFVKEDESLTLDAWAADNTASLNYQVTNNGDSALSYANTIRQVAGTPAYIHSLTSADGTPVAGCYNLANDATPATAPGECYTGSYYDNVSVVVTRYTDEGRTQGATEVYNGKLMTALEHTIETNVSIAAGATHYYTITVTHDDADKNQNLEQTATLKVIPDISSVA